MKLDDLPPHLREQAIRQLQPRASVTTGSVRWLFFDSAKDGKPAETSKPPKREKRPSAPSAKPADNLIPYKPATRHRPAIRVSGAMSKTEAAYQTECLEGKGRFEPVSFKLAGGCRYTPDFMTIDDGVPTFHEVKGSYRLDSEGRAWTAFNEAAAQFPFFRWIWAVRVTKPKKGWIVKRHIEPLPASAVDNSAGFRDIDYLGIRKK